jgi:hypothetical protein
MITFIEDILEKLLDKTPRIIFLPLCGLFYLLSIIIIAGGSAFLVIMAMVLPMHLIIGDCDKGEHNEEHTKSQNIEESIDEYMIKYGDDVKIIIK